MLMILSSKLVYDINWVYLLYVWLVNTPDIDASTKIYKKESYIFMMTKKGAKMLRGIFFISSFIPLDNNKFSALLFQPKFNFTDEWIHNKKLHLQDENCGWYRIVFYNFLRRINNALKTMIRPIICYKATYDIISKNKSHSFD